MADDNTTRPMLETLLTGQRKLTENVTELRSAVSLISEKQDVLASKQDELASKQDELASKQDELASKQDELAAKHDGLEARVVTLTREVHDGFDEYNRRVDALNKRLLNFETWLSRIDDRLHDEIVARTR